MCIATGKVPSLFDDLTPIELSMIQLISPIVKYVVTKGKYSFMRDEVSCVVNDLQQIANQLPRMPSIETISILRHVTKQCSRDYTYRPLRIREALSWLKTHNHLYKDLNVMYPSDFANTNEEVQIPFSELDNFENTCLDNSDATFCSTNPGAPGYDGDGLLFSPDETNTASEDLKIALSGVILRSNTRPLCDPQNYQFFFESAFPNLFPYGIGGMNDIYCVGSESDKNLAHFANYSLRQGFESDGRRMQMCSTFILVAYHYEHRRKIGGVCARASSDERKINNNEDDNSLDPDNDIITLGMIEKIKQKLNDKEDILVDNDIEKESIDNAVETCKPSNRETDDKINRLIKRLTPYAKDLAGTLPHILGERKKLLSMICSPTVLSKATWRFFCTFAPADVYESRLFDIITNSDIRGLRAETQKVAAAESNNNKPEAILYNEQMQRLIEINDELKFETNTDHLLDEDNLRNPIVDQLTKKERTSLLIKFPALAARLFDIKQHCIWTYIINGRSKPFGVVVDFWRRIEFQLRGTPHAHCMIATANEDKSGHTILSDDIMSNNVTKTRPILNLVNNVMTCKLLQRQPGDYSNLNIEGKTNEDIDTLIQNENDFNFNTSTEYFDDLVDPRRRRFDSTFDYDMKSDGSGFKDPRVHFRSRQHQLANQMHRCCFTCWKYAKGGDKICRFHFPWPEQDMSLRNDSRIVSDRDAKHRVRVRVLPERNNGHINNCYSSKASLVAFASGGNTDVQFCAGPYGAAEYCATYAGKPEESDTKLLRNLFVKRIEYLQSLEKTVTERNQLKSMCKALNESRRIGTVEACYYLLKLKFVTSSRVVDPINTLPRSLIAKNLDLTTTTNGNSTVTVGLEINNAVVAAPVDMNQDAAPCGVHSHIGKRIAYAEIMQQQQSLPDYNNPTKNRLTLFSLLTSFTIENNTPSHLGKSSKIPPLYELDANGIVLNPIKCYTENYVYVPLQKLKVLNLSPSIPINDKDSRSAFSTLLLHVPWMSEQNLYGQHSTPTEHLQYLIENELLPSYLLAHRHRTHRSEQVLANQGTPRTRDIAEGSDITCDENGEEYSFNSFLDTSLAPVRKPDTDIFISSSSSVNSNDIQQNITPNDKQYYTTFINTQHKNFMSKFSNDYQIQSTDQPSNSIFGKNNFQLRIMLLEQLI